MPRVVKQWRKTCNITLQQGGARLHGKVNNGGALDGIFSTVKTVLKEFDYSA